MCYLYAHAERFQKSKEKANLAQSRQYRDWYKAGGVFIKVPGLS